MDFMSLFIIYVVKLMKQEWIDNSSQECIASVKRTKSKKEDYKVIVINSPKLRHDFVPPLALGVLIQSQRA